MTLKHLFIFVLGILFIIIGVGYRSPTFSQTPTLEVVKIYFTDRSQLDTLESQGIDLFEEATDTYVVGQVTPEQKQTLSNQGLTVEPVPDPQSYKINFDPSCYKNYDELKEKLKEAVRNYPNLVEALDIGDSWEKTQGKADRDLGVIKITNKTREDKKPKIFIEAAHHAREIATPELIVTLGDKLLEGYGKEADLTYLIDSTEIYLLALANPDGHTHAEKGESWRKNTDDSNSKCPGGYPPYSYGIDMNRNYDTAWGGASKDPCHVTYQGPRSFSEPETQAIRDFVGQIKPNLVIDIHSYSELVMYPWGWTRNTPKDAAGLSNIANKFASYNGYRAGQISRILYTTTGNSVDWFYDKFDIPSFFFEIGKTFTPSCSALPGIIDENLPALIYAIRISQDPYNLVKGPDATDLKLTPLGGNKFKLEATISDKNTGGQPISSAEYHIDDSGLEDMQPKDGKFDSPTEDVEVEIDVSNLSPGKHVVFVLGRDTNQNLGPKTAIYLEVGDEPPPEQKITLNRGWNTITWTDTYPELEARVVPSSIDTDCGEGSGKAVAQLKGDFYQDYIPEYGGINFKLTKNGTYWIRWIGESETCQWTPSD